MITISVVKDCIRGWPGGPVVRGSMWWCGGAGGGGTDVIIENPISGHGVGRGGLTGTGMTGKMRRRAADVQQMRRTRG